MRIIRASGKKQAKSLIYEAFPKVKPGTIIIII
jgi:hypothetical protein